MQITLHNADSVNALVVDEFDVMITDPPYSEHVHANATSSSSRGGTRHRDFGFSHIDHTYREAIASWAKRAKRWSVVYSDVEGAHHTIDAVTSAGVEYVRTVPWVRWSMPQLSGDHPPQGFEKVLLFHAKGRKHWSGPGNLTHLAHPCLRGEGKHKAEKPLAQLLDLVSWFSDESETVFDPFMGSGTTALACLMLGRCFVGSELDMHWFEHASARINSELSPRDLDQVKRWLAQDDEPTSALSEGPSLVRAAKRKTDKDRVRECL